MGAAAAFLLWLVALAFGMFGVLFLISPERMAGTVTVMVLTPMARTEIMAMYGGLELGIAAFLAHCAYNPTYRRAGLLASACMLLGLGAIRLFGALTNGGTQPLMWQVLIVELVGGVVALALWRRA